MYERKHVVVLNLLNAELEEWAYSETINDNWFSYWPSGRSVPSNTMGVKGYYEDIFLLIGREVLGEL